MSSEPVDSGFFVVGDSKSPCRFDSQVSGYVLGRHDSKDLVDITEL